MLYAGRLLILVGILFIAIGFLLTFLSNFTILPRLPGDIYIKRDNFVFYFPITTSIGLSIFLTIMIHYFTRK